MPCDCFDMTEILALERDHDNLLAEVRDLQRKLDEMTVNRDLWKAEAESARRRLARAAEARRSR